MSNREEAVQALAEQLKEAARSRPDLYLELPDGRFRCRDGEDVARELLQLRANRQRVVDALACVWQKRNLTQELLSILRELDMHEVVEARLAELREEDAS